MRRGSTCSPTRNSRTTTFGTRTSTLRHGTRCYATRNSTGGSFGSRPATYKGRYGTGGSGPTSC